LTPAQTVLGGFSQGTVMSYAMALSADRPVPAGVLALSGFIPSVPGWEPQFSDRQSMRVLISHGRLDPVIGVQFGQRARDALQSAGLTVDYREFEGGHNVDPRDLPRVIEWLASTLGR
jgi:phospholipase/carboxylesterase